MLARSLPLFFTGVALAQTSFVSSAHFATTEAPLNNSYPFGSTQTPFRYQQVHDDVPGMAIHGFALRHNCTAAGAPAAAFTITIDAWISTATAGSQAASPTFATNHGADVVQCVTNRTVVVPASDPMQLPSPFTLEVPFDTGVAFAFAGAPASLCWEVQVTARTNTADVSFDAVPGVGPIPASPSFAATRGGTGCIASGQTVPMRVLPTVSPIAWPTGPGSATSTLTVNASYLRANGAFVWVTGLGREAWGGVVLPFTLPSSTTSTSGTCLLYTDLALLTGGVAASNATAQLAMPLTMTTGAHGFMLHTQVVGFDPAANPLGFTTSNLAVQQVVAPFATPLPVSRVYLGGSLGPTGSFDTATFLVTKFF